VARGAEVEAEVARGAEVEAATEAAKAEVVEMDSSL